MQAPPRIDLLDGEALRGILAAGTVALERNVEAVNALNVFPVPDGDTGTNMLFTLRAMNEMAPTTPAPLDATAHAIARGALLGARGNSGVILSQFFRGLARAWDGCQHADPRQVGQAFQEGAATAYKAVGNPVEGTILTVIRCTSEAMTEALELNPNVSLVDVVQAALKGCREAVLKTPEQLAVLKSAGVVDAGGQGFALILEAALRYLQGEGVDSLYLEVVQPSAHVQQSFLEATEAELYGYCTQLLISGFDLDPDALRIQVDAMAVSTVVVGDESLVKIHAHAFDPGRIISLGASVGSLSQVNIENIDEQHQEFQAAHRLPQEEVALGVVAVVLGDGLEELFRNLGVRAVLTGGQTMNPSCQEILDAVESLSAQATLVLANNSNVIPAANQAAELSPRQVRVIPSRNIPQGVAAMLAYNPEGEMETNAQAMEQALTLLQTGEVVTAVHDATIDGLAVAAGEVMAILDGALVASASSRIEALEALVDAASPAEGSLVTLYWGGDATAEEGQEAAHRLQQRRPEVEVEHIRGGQPHYHYLLSIE